MTHRRLRIDVKTKRQTLEEIPEEEVQRLTATVSPDKLRAQAEQIAENAGPLLDAIIDLMAEEARGGAQVAGPIEMRERLIEKLAARLQKG